MSDKATGIMGIALGALFLLIWAVSAVWKASQGKRTLDGEVTEIDEENRIVVIRYRADKETCCEYDYPALGAFISGRIPPVGLKVSVTVYKQAPDRPVSVLMIPASDRVSRKPYFNSSNTLNAARILAVSLFCIAGGVIALWG